MNFGEIPLIFSSLLGRVKIQTSGSQMSIFLHRDFSCGFPILSFMICGLPCTQSTFLCACLFVIDVMFSLGEVAMPKLKSGTKLFKSDYYSLFAVKYPLSLLWWRLKQQGDPMFSFLSYKRAFDTPQLPTEWTWVVTHTDSIWQHHQFWQIVMFHFASLFHLSMDQLSPRDSTCTSAKVSDLSKTGLLKLCYFNCHNFWKGLATVASFLSHHPQLFWWIIQNEQLR